MSDVKTPARNPARLTARKAANGTVAATMDAALKAARIRTHAAAEAAVPVTSAEVGKKPTKGAAKGTESSKKPGTKKKSGATPAGKPKPPQAPVAAPAPSRAKTPNPHHDQPKAEAVKLRDLVDQVVIATGARKKGVKELVEATLSHIGAALARGDELNLPGFGKVRVVKSDTKDGTTIMTLKVRQGTGGASAGGAKQTLADTGDDD
jgi:nucleoid DNA-binding protein